MKTLALLIIVVTFWPFVLTAQEVKGPAPTSATPSTVGGTPAPGKYTGTFKNIASNLAPMGMELLVASSAEGRVSGDVVLYAGSCRGEKRPFIGEVKGNRLEGRVSGPARCSDLTLALEVQGNRLNGTMQGSNNFDVQLSR